MHTSTTTPPRLISLRLKYRNRFDAMAMLFYVCLVYAWSVNVYPLGRDYAILGGGGAGLPFLVRTVISWEVSLFGSFVPGYHLVNIALVYAAMLCIYRLVNYTLKGMWWFGTLAACLFMANPVHTEAVVNLTGAVDLVPFLVALLAITFYAAHAYEPGIWRYSGALLCFAVAVISYPLYAYLILVLFLYDLLITEPDLKNYKRLLPFLVVTACAFWTHGGMLFAHGFDCGRMFSPLYFIFYPIGFLPETARRFHEHPALGWFAGAAAFVILALVYRKARRPAILFGVLAMCAIRLYPGDRFIDPVHLIGGGQLLLANVFFLIALVALFYRIMEDPNWRVAMIGLTTVISIAFFVMQIRENVIWHKAGNRVHAFQTQAREALVPSHDTPLGICPDFQYWLGAPLCFTQSLTHDTPFSTALPVKPVVMLDGDKAGAVTVTQEEWARENGVIRVSGASALEVAPWPYDLSRPGRRQRKMPLTIERIEGGGEDHFLLAVSSRKASPVPTDVLLTAPPKDE